MKSHSQPYKIALCPEKQGKQIIDTKPKDYRMKNNNNPSATHNNIAVHDLVRTYYMHINLHREIG